MTSTHFSYKALFGIYNMVSYIFRKEIYGDKDVVASNMCRHMQEYEPTKEELDFVETCILKPKIKNITHPYSKIINDTDRDLDIRIYTINNDDFKDELARSTVTHVNYQVLFDEFPEIGIFFINRDLFKLNDMVDTIENKKEALLYYMDIFSTIITGFCSNNIFYELFDILSLLFFYQVTDRNISLEEYKECSKFVNHGFASAELIYEIVQEIYKIGKMNEHIGVPYITETAGLQNRMAKLIENKINWAIINDMYSYKRD